MVAIEKQYLSQPTVGASSSRAAGFKREDWSNRYFQSTQETIQGLYAKRDPKTGEPIENINDIIERVSLAVAIAELKYVLSPSDLSNLTFEQALNNEKVIHWANFFAHYIGNQFFWANTPANINADPVISLKVLNYWAHGKLAGMSEEEIWMRSQRLMTVRGTQRESALSEHEKAMATLARELQGKGCLAACGVAYVADNLESIQQAAHTEALAAKAAMGMGINTSTLRPWSSLIANGAAASGPDRFYEKTIAKAVEAVAQGGRRGGALIELRNSDHPDILFFIDKKRLLPPPSLSRIYKELLDKENTATNKNAPEFKKHILAQAEKRFGELYARYLERQNYLKNTNVTVLAMPGFMQAVETKSFYPASFSKSAWQGPLYDPRHPVIDERSGQIKINRLTKEPTYCEYVVDRGTFPEAVEAARRLAGAQVEISATQVKVPGHFYAPDVFKRIIEGMRDSGEPGLAFYEHVNAANANDHVYELNTCNPCGEQFLPAGPGLDGRFYMGNCNLSSMHAAHHDFWKADGSYDMSAMAKVALIQQRFMDNVTDISWYPLPAQNMTARLERRNGGGFAGIAEFLSRLGLEFGSEKALKATEELYREYANASLEASIELAKERGVYPLWEGSRFAKKGLSVRNTCMINNAPTGTLAQALQTSWGVDPHNGIVFSRKVRTRYVDFVAPGFKEAMEKENAWPASEEKEQALMQKIRDNHKSCRGLEVVPKAVQVAFPTRLEVSPQAYIRHLAAIHKGASACPESFNSVSNTCSIPLYASEGEVRDAAFLAWKLKVKDITFYPDGSRISQPIEQIAAEKREEEPDLFSLLASTQDMVLEQHCGDRKHGVEPRCGECGSEQWLRFDGCMICQSCGFSQCG
jgi:ribonucleotide reductase alpha subunit